MADFAGVNQGVNFGILQPAPASQVKMVSAPQQSGGGMGGIGGILSGIGSLGKSIGNMMGSNPVSTANNAVNTAMQAQPTAQVANSILPGSGQALQQQQAVMQQQAQQNQAPQQTMQAQPQQGGQLSATSAVLSGNNPYQHNLPGASSLSLGQTPGIPSNMGSNQPNTLQAQNLNGYNPQAAQQAAIPNNLGYNPTIPNQPQQQMGAKTPVSNQQILGALKTGQNQQSSPQAPKGVVQAAPASLGINDSDTLHNTMSSIAQIETGGAKNPYMAMTQAGHGQTAIGKYQILSSNVPSWTKAATGTAMTPQQFMHDPQAQETTAAYQMNSMLQQGHSPNDVASMWFTGKPLAQAGTNVKDALGTSNGQYQAQFNKYFNQGQTQKSANVANIGQDNIHQATQAAAINNNPYNVASKYLGDGVKSHADVLSNFFQKSGVGNVNIQNTPWCAAFANSVLKASGMQGTNSLAAKSFLNYGTPTSNPSKGDIAVFNDLTGKNNTSHGHVGFVDSIYSKGGQQYVRTLGGNESGQVMIKDYPMSKVAGFRVPPSAQELQQKVQGSQQMQAQGGQQPYSQMTLNDSNDRLLPPMPVQQSIPAVPQAQAPQAAPQGQQPPGLSNGQLRVADTPALQQQQKVLQPFMQSLSQA